MGRMCTEQFSMITVSGLANATVCDYKLQLLPYVSNIHILDDK